MLLKDVQKVQLLNSVTVAYQAIVYIWTEKNIIDKGLFKSTLELPLTTNALQRPLFLFPGAVHTLKIEGKADRTAKGWGVIYKFICPIFRLDRTSRHQGLGKAKSIHWFLFKPAPCCNGNGHYSVLVHPQLLKWPLDNSQFFQRLTKKSGMVAKFDPYWWFDWRSIYSAAVSINCLQYL